MVSQKCTVFIGPPCSYIRLASIETSRCSEYQYKPKHSGVWNATNDNWLSLWSDRSLTGRCQRSWHLWHRRTHQCVDNAAALWQSEWKRCVNARNLHKQTQTLAKYNKLRLSCLAPYYEDPLPSTRQHPSYGDCLEVKREYYQNSSVLDCVIQCSQSAAHLYEQFL